MHELTIARSIVDIAESELRRYEKVRVTRITLQIGALSGIEMEAFDFAWPEAVRGTVLEGAECEVERTEGRLRCLRCGTEFGVSEIYEVCPNCGSFENELASGHELRIKSLEIYG
jgi:hydrogenase nickel incorporation protein HypA/HybF